MKGCMTSLKRLLAYKNSDVVLYFSQTYGISKAQSELIFNDMLRFLWVSEKYNRISKSKLKNSEKLHYIYMLDYYIVIDEIWHLFILHCDHYSDFCKKYFGTFIKHKVNIIPKSLKKNNDLKLYSKDKISDEAIQSQMSFIYDELGPDVVSRWFSVYPKKYSHVKLMKKKLKAYLLKNKLPLSLD